MSYNMKSGLQKVVVIITMMMLLSSSLLFPVSAVSVPETVEPVKNKSNPVLVHIYYDAESVEAKSMVLDTINPLIKANILVESFDIPTILLLDLDLDRYQPDYAIYYFQSSQAGLTIRDNLVSWELVADVIGDYPLIEHVFGVGSAYNLKDHLGDADNLHVDEAEVLDVRLGRLYAIWKVADTMSMSDEPAWAETGEELREIVLRDFSDNINEYFAKGVYPESYTGENVPDPITDPALTQSWVVEEKQYDTETGDELQPIMRLGTPAADEDYLDLMEMAPESGIGGPMGWLIDTLILSLIGLGFKDLSLHINAAESINNHMQGIVEEGREKIIDWMNVTAGLNVTNKEIPDLMHDLLPGQMFELWSFLDQMMLDYWYEVDEYIGEFFDWIINTPVQTELQGLIPVFLFRLGTPMNLGSNFASFGAVIRVKLLPDFEIDRTP
ncbi:MAG: hypothetical protein ACTSU3_00480, partial [Candidatus Thorarchaeota archaeon]